MMRTLAFAVASALACAAGPVAAQGTFAGMVAYKILNPDGKTVVLRYYVRGTLSRQEFEAGGQMGAYIADATTGDMTMLMPQRKQYIVINLKTGAGPMAQMAQGMAGGHGPGASMPKAPDLSKLKVTATGQHETIAGISCEVYHFASSDPNEHMTVDVCGAKGMGFLGHEAAMMPSTATLLSSGQPELVALAHDGFFPLK